MITIVTSNHGNLCYIIEYVLFCDAFLDVSRIFFFFTILSLFQGRIGHRAHRNPMAIFKFSEDVQPELFQRRVRSVPHLKYS